MSVYFCTGSNGHLLPKGICSAIRLTWKFILMNFHMVDMIDAPFHAPGILPRAMRRLYERILAWEHGWQRQAFLLITNGVNPSNSTARVAKLLAPFASDATEDGERRLALHPAYRDYLHKHGAYSGPSQPE